VTITEEDIFTGTQQTVSKHSGRVLLVVSHPFMFPSHPAHLRMLQ